MPNIDDAKITFIRIPKNASTSLYSFFGSNNAIRNEYLPADNDTYLNIFESSHCSISGATDLLGDGILSNPVLAVVRNPYERLLSMYFFAKKYNLASIYDVDIKSFDGFVRDFFKLSGFKNFFHAMSQCEYIYHNDMINITVVRFEQLDDGISKFIESNGLTDHFNSSEIPKLNSTNHNHYSDYYSAESRDIVQEMWNYDLENFNYSFDYE